MTQHTTGPWQVWNFTDDARHLAVGPEAGGLAVAEVVACNAHGCYTAETEQRGEANARLIAAAPDLLAALQMVDRIWSHGWTTSVEPDSPLATVRAALARATGAA